MIDLILILSECLWVDIHEETILKAGEDSIEFVLHVGAVPVSYHDNFLVRIEIILMYLLKNGQLKVEVVAEGLRSSRPDEQLLELDYV